MTTVASAVLFPSESKGSGFLANERPYVLSTPTEIYIKAKNQFQKCVSMWSLANSTHWLPRAFRGTTGHTIMAFMWHTDREESVVWKMVLSQI